MKIVRFQYNNSIKYGILDAQDRIRQLSSSPFEDLQTDSEPIALAKVRLLAPVIPPNLLAIGLNYRQHARETGASIPDHPLLFIKATTSITDPDSPIILPREAPDEVDYEAELAVVIGRRARHITEEQAPDCILGYTCANDVSARDCQKKYDKQWARAKSFDTFCPLGPWIETDLNPGNRPIRSRINGETRQQSVTSDLIFTVPELISYLSQQMTLLPGTVILTGTPSGVGMASDPPRFLRDGDVCEIEIDGIGTLRNPVKI